jgi:hypothetical protein
MTTAALKPDREAVRAASPLVELVAELTAQAIPAMNGSREVKFRCPWHDDSHASLRVNVAKQTYFCDPCHEGGDVFRFVERYRECDFSAALAFLASRAGLSANVAKRRCGSIVATYDYRDVAGVVRYQSIRYAPKGFSQRRPDANGGWIDNLHGVEPVIYRLPELKGQSHAFVVEGEKDCDRLWRLGLPATCNHGGAGKWKRTHAEQLRNAGVTAVTVLPDNDDAGQRHAIEVKDTCRVEGIEARIFRLPGLGPKGDISDWLDSGHTTDELRSLLQTPADNQPTEPSIAGVDAVFGKWLGAEYDLEAMHVVLAAAAAERLSGDPLWLLIISGPGNAKTETIQSLSGAGAIVTSTISSEGALLSATPRREKSKDATGGLLRRMGQRGILVVKDVTSILTMNRDSRSSVLAAFREVYDGRWERNVGTDGGRSILWEGRLAVIGACTTAWDDAREVIATMGDRFVVVRTDSSDVTGRLVSGRQAIANTGSETLMRSELAASVGALLTSISTDAEAKLTEAEQDRILAAANIVTLARTAVTYDYRGDVVEAHAPEAPTRFAKQLGQVVRGALAIGLDRGEALRLAIRCARDSMPPLRLAILEDVADHPDACTRDVRRRLQKPRNTVDRQLQALHMLGLVVCDEEERGEVAGKPATVWRYQLAEGVNLEALTVPDLSPHTLSHSEREGEEGSSASNGCGRMHSPTDISGTTQSGLLANHDRLMPCGGGDGRAY